MIQNMGDDQARKLQESLRIELDYKNEYTQNDIKISLDNNSIIANKNSIVSDRIPKTLDINQTKKSNVSSKKSIKSNAKIQHLDCDLSTFDK